MKLDVGLVAPQFEVEDIFGNPVSLRSYRGKVVLLSFFRNAACALCNLQIHHLIQRFPTYHARGLEIIAVFESPRESILDHVSKQNAPFPIVADPDAALYDLYGVETSEEKVMAPVDGAWRTGMIHDAEAIGYPLIHEEGSNFFRMPADFLIGPDQRLQVAFYSDAVGEHISFETIDAALRQVA
ncbi:MAG TPA: peroxiredoxin-like family protein [Chloroflexota bacterium]